MSKASELLARNESEHDSSEIDMLKAARRLLDSGDVDKAKAVIDEVIEHLIFGSQS